MSNTFYIIYRCSSMVASYAAVVCLLRVVIRTYLRSVFYCIVSPAHTMPFLSFVGRRDNERRKIAQCERAADNRFSLTRQRDSCWTDSKIESVQLLLNESERSFDQRRIV